MKPKHSLRWIVTCSQSFPNYFYIVQPDMFTSGKHDKPEFLSSWMRSCVKLARWYQYFGGSCLYFQGSPKTSYLTRPDIPTWYAAIQHVRPHPVTVSVTYLYRYLSTPPQLHKVTNNYLRMHTETNSGHPSNKCFYKFSSRLNGRSTTNFPSIWRSPHLHISTTSFHPVHVYFVNYIF